MKNIFDELLAEGYAEGFAIGYAIGYAKAVVEVNEEVARKMKEYNFDLSYISKITSLPVERIAQL